MRFLDLNRYSLISFVATLIAIAYSFQKSLFHTPTSILNLGLLKSLEPILKDVVPPFASPSSVDSALTELLRAQERAALQLPRVVSTHLFSTPDQLESDSHAGATGSKQGSTFVDNSEHGRLLGGAAGVGASFRPSVFQEMLAERYLRFRTPSPAVLLQLQVILSYLQNEKLCVLVFTNMAFCLAFLAGRLFLRTFFGDLRVIERQHMYDRTLNFLLFKVVFVGAILEPRWEELLIWTAWFTILGFLRVFSMLCRDRFEYITVSPNIPTRVHVKILTMLSMILVSNIAWFVLCISVFRSMLLLLSFECFTLLLDTVQTLVKYVIHLGDLSRQGPCESRRMVQYYIEFVTDTMILVTTLGHYLHIMYLHGISFTLIDAVLFLNMRSVFNNLRKKLASHQSYRQALSNMQALYPSATDKELEDYSDDCAICRDSMTSAKILPCGHIFHLFCIRSWLEHHSSCPTCRRALGVDADANRNDRIDTRGFVQNHNTPARNDVNRPVGRTVGETSHNSAGGQQSTTASTQSSDSAAPFPNSHTPANHPLNTASSTAQHAMTVHHTNNHGSNANRPSGAGGHQLFAFNSEQQPWMTRLGFPRIRVEVVDPTHDEDSDEARAQRYHQHQQLSGRRRSGDNGYMDDEDDEDLRRAIAESLAMSTLTKSPSTTSLPSYDGTTISTVETQPVCIEDGTRSD
ncbi:hypothetical protein BGW38_003953 [Lunasporangiospora selenospora]|uniref:RING-type domain-containing protein n=1 Tax=Lunasporangiospora selenospora TaxID=979761 RepID=A0A9P6FPY4_9FUNG|nr:hypothetical protein BGW38_003953 [Lunasporangiospora selenospora]